MLRVGKRRLLWVPLGGVSGSLNGRALKSMECYQYELPTTGAISFTEICVDKSSKYTTHLATATSARARLRTALKECKHTDGEKDYLKLVKVVTSLEPPPPD
jgi:hypothetical protein